MIQLRETSSLSATVPLFVSLSRLYVEKKTVNVLVNRRRCNYGSIIAHFVSWSKYSHQKAVMMSGGRIRK
jgi:hypothetical protein